MMLFCRCYVLSFLKCPICYFTEELKEHFVQYGEITNISLKTDPATGRSRGFAFIIFKSVDGLNNVWSNDSNKVLHQLIVFNTFLIFIGICCW